MTRRMYSASVFFYNAEGSCASEDSWYQFNDEEVLPLSSFHRLASGDAGKPIILTDDDGSK